MSRNDKNPEIFFVGARRCLLCSDVQGWFSESNLSVPSKESVTPIVGAVNHFDLFRHLWRDDPVYKERRRQNESVKRLTRIAKALKTLEQDIPIALELTRLGYTGDFETLKKPYDDLLSAVNFCMPGVEVYLSRPRGRSRAGWHRIARQLAPLFKEAGKAAGLPKLGFKKPTSLGIQLVKRALHRLGIDESEETIVEAMRSPRERRGRRKNGESKNDIPQTPYSI